MVSKSGRLAAQAVERAREQIEEIGEAAAWGRWRDDWIVWRLAQGPDSSPVALFDAGAEVMSAERDRRSRPVACLAAQYVVGALLLVLLPHARPPFSPGSGSASVRSLLSDGDGKAPADGEPGEPLARALTALAEACGQARSRPALLRELRRLHHGVARVRGAVVQARPRPREARSGEEQHPRSPAGPGDNGHRVEGVAPRLR